MIKKKKTSNVTSIPFKIVIKIKFIAKIIFRRRRISARIESDPIISFYIFTKISITFHHQSVCSIPLCSMGRLPSRPGPPAAPDYPHNMRTERSMGTCPTSGQRRARWRAWGGSAAPRGKVKIENGKVKICGAWIVIFEGIWNWRGKSRDFLSYYIKFRTVLKRGC